MNKGNFDFLSFFLKLLVYICTAICMGTVLFIIGYILYMGIPHISPKLFSVTYTSENASLLPALFNTVLMTLLSLLIAVPVGIFSAIFLNEYSKSRSFFVKAVRITSETLSGIPSIVYGLFGYLLFLTTLGMKYSLFAGALTLSIMILPLVMRTSQEALKSVPTAFREGSLGLGAGKLRTIFKIVLPYSKPGIFAGIVLGVGRIVGETAALIYTAGTATGYAKNLFTSGRTLSVHMYCLSNEGLYVNEAYATAVVLLLLVVGINSLSAFIARRL